MKHKFCLFICLIFFIAQNFAQQDSSYTFQVTELQAKEAVYGIVKHTGLTPDFIIQENREVKTAVAFIKSKKRYIEFNPDIIGKLVDSTQTDWAAVSILAHEIAHHLLGHTLEVSRINIGDELACDKFSGFILHQMGATLSEALSAMEIIGTPEGDHIHAPKTTRLEVIQIGWEEAQALKNNDGDTDNFLTKTTFQFSLEFEGDENNYYITTNNEVVWYDNFAKPIKFGMFTVSKRKSYRYEIHWEGSEYLIDSNNKIWHKTNYDVMMIVGELLVIP